ncbi:hypothetical protein DESUT3_03790 [Desulfuromonas versatilis]|uniref:Uncharacterized protein n=1 Tax=Desulfuromonas versatilis TaxID=2802975 RepID=A0ABN6DTA3_9BACT|nr:hypothetical protein [Desulfuromonas versatilis]BCR03310.1 hypothetical protein DESUT3_03790 [Desulfuromonas versatilis]
MPIAPPPEELLEQPEMELMELFGRMRWLTEEAGFSGSLPSVWQCSDESQAIKKALFGYVFDCPVFNLGRVGALLDPNRLLTASRHGHDLIIHGGSHIGAREEGGIGYVDRVHGSKATCCGMLGRLLDEYLQLYRRAAALITLFRGVGGVKIEIPYKYLFHKPAQPVARIHIHLEKLADGEAVRDSSHGKVYRLNADFAARHERLLEAVSAEREPIGELLGADCFHFSKELDHQSLDPRTLLEVSLFEFLPDIVTSTRPHRRLVDVNTWRQFHRLASYLTDSFDSGERNILVVAGRTIDHSIRRNTFVPQFGFWMEQGRALQARYFGPQEVGELLRGAQVYRPPRSFLEYAGVPG